MNGSRTRIFSIGLIAVALLAAAPATAQVNYDAALAQYNQARAPYEEAATAYWDDVSDKRRIRNARRRANEPIRAIDYVLTQPPVSKA